MKTLKLRLLIYSALLVLCGVAGSLVGFGAALWTFVQIVAVIELIHWLGALAGDSARSW
jgi:hypothetical protein